MNKITFLPSTTDLISKIVEENNIVTEITLIQDDHNLFMEFDTELHDRWITARILLKTTEDHYPWQIKEQK